MNSTTKELMKTATTHLAIADSAYGSRVPRLTVVFGRGVPHRLMNAALHALAAEAEMATPAHEKWGVQIESGRDRGWLDLELDTGSDAEAERGLALLRKVVA